MTPFDARKPENQERLKELYAIMKKEFNPKSSSIL
jgi:hypothetical protein